MRRALDLRGDKGVMDWVSGKARQKHETRTVGVQRELEEFGEECGSQMPVRELCKTHLEGARQSGERMGGEENQRTNHPVGHG